ncbi:MAG: hypothetical protein H7Y14_11870 [Burkholderiales bacterium]|nr:hypothetical protein [Burkholderiales bacterium]
MVAEYAAGPGLSLAAGTLHIDYRAPRSSHARLGELTVDGMGLGRPPATTAFVGKSEQWMSHHGERECPRVRERIGKLGPDAASRAVLGALLAAPHPGFETRLVYWKSVRDPDRRLTTHAFVLKVDDTGNMLIDYVRAWLVVPASAKGALPLVVLSHQGHLYAAMEPLGAQGEVELGAAAELARHGIASLAYDAAPFGTPRASFATEYLQYYPASGTTAKDLDNLKRLLDRVLDPRTRPMAGATFDRARIGIWGFSYGSWISMLAGALDDRIRAVAFSSFHYRDSDIARGLSDSLYIPQLACFAASAPPPISTRRILREYGRNALAVAPDVGLLSEWTAGLADDRVLVVVNPFGHVVSPFERSFVLEFFYRAFAIRARSPVEGPVHVMASTVAEMAPYIQRENRWRDELVKAMRAP